MLRARLFDVLSRLAARQTLHVFWIATLLTVASVVVSTNIDVRTNFKDLLGPDDLVSQRMSALEDEYPIASSVRVLLEAEHMSRLMESARITAPARAEQGVMGVALVARADRVSTSVGQVLVEGSLRRTPTDPP